MARAGSLGAHPWRLLLLAGLLLAISLPPALVAGAELLHWSDLGRLFRPRPGIEQAVLETLRVPRVLVALLVGAALGVAGALMQTVLRNDLASPDIMGVTSAAQLALVVNHLLLAAAVPDLAVTTLGGLAGCLMSLALAGGPRAAPARLALAGTALSLGLHALSSAIVLLADDRASGLVLWSAGFLDQTGWARLDQIGPSLVLGLLVALALARSLDIAALGQDTAASLGLGRTGSLLALGSAVLLSGAAVSLAGPIGFIGLAVPHLARALVGSRHRHVLPLSAVAGALVLLWADTAAQTLSAGGALPTGAIVACLGAPLMLVVVLRGAGGGLAPRPRALPRRFQPNSAILFASLVLFLPLAALLGLIAGDGGAWPTAGGALALRLPRVVAAAGAGALLGLSGLLLQTVTRNPLAGPETLGLLQGAALFSLVAIGLGLAPGSPGFALATTMGALVVVLLLALLKVGREPFRLVLCGVALAAGFGALSTLLVVGARFQMTEALSWLAGSTHGRSLAQAIAPVPVAVLLLPALWCLRRSLDFLLLGEATARSFGVPAGPLRWLALSAAALATGLAVGAVGAVGFVGLIAPHMMRMLGATRHATLLPATMLTGAGLTILADAAGRTVLSPYELPMGIVTALIGVPVFIGFLRHQT